eukprot:6115813-Amphidinium_carterae.1
MNEWMRRFSEKQLRIKEINAKTVVSRNLSETKKYMPEIPSGLLATMGEAELTHALGGFNAMDSK